MAWPKGKPRGERVPGSGRQAGTRNKRTQAVLEKAEEYGISPLDVMLSTMRDAWESAGKLTDPLEKLSAKAIAVQAAKEAAPYVHARLASVESKVDATHEHRTISADPPSPEEWERIYGGAGVAAAAGPAKGPH